MFIRLALTYFQYFNLNQVEMHIAIFAFSPVIQILVIHTCSSAILSSLSFLSCEDIIVALLRVSTLTNMLVFLSCHVLILYHVLLDTIYVSSITMDFLQ